MTTQIQSQNYAVSVGTAPSIVPHFDVRAPAATDINFPIGKVWVNKAANTSYILTSFTSSLGTLSANWSINATGAGALDTLTGDSGTATPSSGNIQIAGTAGQIETSAAGAIVTLAIADPLILTGDLEVGGTLDVVGLSTLGPVTQVGTLSLNASGAATTTIGSAAAGAIVIDTTAGVSIGADAASNFTVTDAGADLTLASTLGSVAITSGENAASAISLTTNAGTSETIVVTASQGTGAGSIALTSTAGGVTVTGGLATADAINIVASNAAGGIDVDAGTGGIAVNAANGAIVVQSGTGAISISNDAAATAVNIGTGAGAKTLTIGSTNTTSATNLTAGSGGVNCATNFALTSVATQFQMNGGAATDFIGSAILSGGTIQVNNTNIAANDLIIYGRSTTGGTPGHLSYTISAGASFTFNSTSGTDTSTIAYVIFRQT